MPQANLLALLLIPLVALLLFVPYRWLWGESLLAPIFDSGLRGFLITLALFFGGIVLHEWLHALGFRLVGKVPANSIQYGFNWKGLAPYAHCHAPMRARAYRFAVALPGLALGVLPALVGLVAGVWWLVVWGALMLISAGGDLAVLLVVRHVPGEALVQDHPTMVGCHVLK
ncbi:MAG: DUF3267 domain-containing protein [Anaerolineae bacterium]|nr:DUF3267 domain-containing protein [Anaerolineae bacterium]